MNEQETLEGLVTYRIDEVKEHLDRLKNIVKNKHLIMDRINIMRVAMEFNELQITLGKLLQASEKQ